MPKALCLISLVASILIVLLFLADAGLGMMGMNDITWRKPIVSLNFMSSPPMRIS